MSLGHYSQWFAGKCVTAGSPDEKSLVGNVCLFL